MQLERLRSHSLSCQLVILHDRERHQFVNMPPGRARHSVFVLINLDSIDIGRARHASVCVPRPCSHTLIDLLQLSAICFPNYFFCRLLYDRLIHE